MQWEYPSFVEIRMDAEIGSYQDEFQNPPDMTDISNERPRTLTEERKD
ncbi:hypothetical protein YTPLAS18_03540 [Nitrospira sp.]|nr:hypothetical protein YTPLAS18_03540 [Nitrospira sp.]